MGVRSKKMLMKEYPKNAARGRPLDARALLFHKVTWVLRFETVQASQKNCTAALVVFLGCQALQLQIGLLFLLLW